MRRGGSQGPLALLGAALCLLGSGRAAAGQEASVATTDGGTVRELAPGVYAWMTDELADDSNKGFVVGSRGVLVIDSSAGDAAALQAAIRRVTDKPILYVVNTNYHYDHSLGNHAFGAETTVIGHPATVAAIPGEHAARRARLGADAVVGEPRLPDLTVRNSLDVDLGDRAVRIHHFGHGNTAGDLVVYVPGARVAWTGNFVYGEGSIPWLSDTTADALQYQRAVARMAASLDVESIVPGHGPVAGSEILGRYSRYLARLLREVRTALAEGADLADVETRLPYERAVTEVPSDPLFAGLMPTIHRGNVERTNVRLAAELPSTGATPPATARPGDGDAFEVRTLAPDVYGLFPQPGLTSGTGLSVVANGGFVVGSRGVLVVDAGINSFVAERIQAAVRSMTGLPILYVVNTSDHGDHAFGNHAFPSTARIVSHERAAERMSADGYLAHERDVLVEQVGLVSDPAALADVEVREPDLVFDEMLMLDLGGIAVEIHHFGPGQTPGDAVVYVPGSGVAWGGNFLFGHESIPFLFEGGATAYLRSIALASEVLDVDQIVTGHFSVTDASLFERYQDYLTDLLVRVRALKRQGLTVHQAVGRFGLAERFAGGPNDQSGGFWRSIHQVNVRRTYAEVSGDPEDP